MRDKKKRKSKKGWREREKRKKILMQFKSLHCK